jgi:hypothetical protein
MPPTATNPITISNALRMRFLSFDFPGRLISIISVTESPLADSQDAKRGQNYYSFPLKHISITVPPTFATHFPVICLKIL